MALRTPHVIVIGAGAGGLAAAADLARAGVRVTVLERGARFGGKLRQISVRGTGIDAGPTVFTMRWVFEGLFQDAGLSLADHVTLVPLEVLARHAWSAQETLDLFASVDRSSDAIGRFAGAAEAAGYRAFCERARRIYRTLEAPFMRAERPSALSLARRAGPRGWADLWAVSPFATLWHSLSEHFRDPRLRQLFGRYATYSGSSPFQAPATLMLIAHVEQQGVWLVAGGMARLAEAMVRLAASQGVALCGESPVDRILVDRHRVTGVVLTSGERIEADAVFVNADAAALAGGLFGPDAAKAVRPPDPACRSMSAITWALSTTTAGFPLARHNVFFSNDYAAEFDAIFRHASLPAEPTVYVCAQDRDEPGPAPDGSAERLLVLVNAPAIGDRHSFTTTEIEACAERSFGLLRRCGLVANRSPDSSVVTTPSDFARLYPGTGGALYGQAVHGPMAAFRRPGSRGAIPGLYLAGGSVHPGPGVPMAVLSGRLAAARLLADLTSAKPSHPVVMPGGISTR